jgi:N-acetylmuramoyl-L-alanine amidase
VADPLANTLPLTGGDRGEAVRDLQRRLTALGYEPAGETGELGPGTTDAIRRFQTDRGLEVDGECDRHTWTVLVEASYQLGDRLLYLRAPMVRGDDVADLQRRLGSLGFDAGRVDGILGPDTEAALKDFQRNAGLTSDGVCGRDTLDALSRLRTPTGDETSVRMTREREALRHDPRLLADQRVALVDPGGLGSLAGALARGLQTQGAVVAVLHHPDPSEQAVGANEFAADVVLALHLDADACARASYFSVPGFASVGGRRLAEVIADELPPPFPPVQVEGKRLPLLRETRMPAVAVRLGPTETVVEHVSRVAAALEGALRRWAEEPIEG